MGLFDSVKKMLGNSTEAQAAPEVDEDDDESSDAGDDEGEAYDLAGFDPDDEEAFFDAIQQIESGGPLGGTDQSRAQTMARYGLRDHLHWQTVRDSVFTAIARKHGSWDVAIQRQQNYLTGQSQKMTDGNVAAMRASGGMEPVEGVTLEAWAAINAAISGGANFDDLLRGAGIDRARWDRASAEWLARMSRDTTFAIS